MNIPQLTAMYCKLLKVHNYNCLYCIKVYVYHKLNLYSYVTSHVNGVDHSRWIRQRSLLLSYKIFQRAHFNLKRWHVKQPRPVFLNSYNKVFEQIYIVFEIRRCIDL